MAFAKRLTECALHFPPDTAKQALDFVNFLASREDRFAGLLDTEERMFDGVYDGLADDASAAHVGGTNLFEIGLLAEGHYAETVRKLGRKLRDPLEPPAIIRG